MSEIRKCPILDRWVIIATNRSDRPGAFIESPPFEPVDPCPFCAGHESETPSAVLVFPESARPDVPGWRVRVVTNKYPALEPQGDRVASLQGMYPGLEGFGAHEVIIESPRHVASTAELTLAELTDVLLAYKLRLAHWKADHRMVYGQAFKNVGQAAGASLEHAHSQLMVIPMTPAVIREEMSGALAYFRRTGNCPFCDMIEQERTIEKRMILETDVHVAFAPFASRLPMESWILPKRHAGHYEDLSLEDAEDLAHALHGLIGRLEGAVGRCAYNYVIHTTPFDIKPPEHYHWHIEVVPSLARTAGFELGTGYFINPVAPEDAASQMRALK